MSWDLRIRHSSFLSTLASRGLKVASMRSCIAPSASRASLCNSTLELLSADWNQAAAKFQDPCSFRIRVGLARSLHLLSVNQRGKLFVLLEPGFPALNADVGLCEAGSDSLQEAHEQPWNWVEFHTLCTCPTNNEIQQNWVSDGFWKLLRSWKFNIFAERGLNWINYVQTNQALKNQQTGAPRLLIGEVPWTCNQTMCLPID